MAKASSLVWSGLHVYGSLFFSKVIVAVQFGKGSAFVVESSGSI